MIEQTKIKLDERYVLFKIKGDKEDRKEFKKDEINGNLTFPKSMKVNNINVYPLRCLTLYIKGKFENWLDGQYYSTRNPGECADRITTETWQDNYTKFIEDNSLYFCIYKKNTDNFLYRQSVKYDDIKGKTFDHEIDIFICDEETAKIYNFKSGQPIILDQDYSDKYLYLVYEVEK